MHRPFIATLAAAALAIATIGSTPARADSSDMGKLFVAAIGLAALGVVIKNQKDKREEEKEREAREKKERDKQLRQARQQSKDRGKDHDHEYWRHRDHDDHVGRGSQSLYGGQSHISPRPLPRDVQRRLLPGQCLESHDSRNGSVHMFTDDCLARNFGYVKDLPGQCHVSARGRKGPVAGYEVNCLRNRGYELARR